MTVSRPLTKGEIQLARQVFGDSIDYAAVKIHDKPYLPLLPLQPKNSGMTPNGEIYTRDSYSPDYSRENLYTRAFFIHEMTHVWQYQNKVLHPAAEAVKLNLKHKFNYAAAYDFQLDKSKDLVRYDMEQQAAIVQEYFLLKHRKADATQYEAVLKKFLDNPSYARRKSFLHIPFVGKALGF
jgi:hypothetical protein